MLPLVVVAAAHAALAFRTGMLSYEIPVVIGWLGVVMVQSERSPGRPGSRAERGFGIGLAAAALGLAAFWSGDYHAALRLTPLALGAGLLLARLGTSGLRASGRELWLLALPVIVPPPAALRHYFEPQGATLRFTELLLDLAGRHASISGDVLSARGGAIHVLSECSGINAMSQLAALAVLLVCLFETTRRQKASILVASIAAGFVANCSRLALLVVLSGRDYEAFELWHSWVGELRFTCLGLALAALAWWLLLRSPRRTPQPA